MNKYTLKSIMDKTDNKHIAIVYNGEFAESMPISVELVNNGSVIQQGNISNDNTSVFFGPLDPNSQYNVKIHEANDVLSTDFTVDADGKLITLSKNLADNINADLNSIAPMAAATTVFLTYQSPSATQALGTYTSLFQAIERARQAGNGSVVKMNGTEVYRHGQAGRYYKYQFTTSYGYVTSKADADKWLSGYLYSHIIESTSARLYGCNWTTLKGTPAPWEFEPNNGGYYYQHSTPSNLAPKFTKATKQVLLSQSRLKLSSNKSQPFNAYVFFSFVSNKMNMDAGLIFDVYAHVWKTCTLVNWPAQGIKKFSVGSVVCGAKQNSAGEYITDTDVELTVSITSKNLTLVVKRLDNGQTATEVLNYMDPSATYSFVSSVSYVPAPTDPHDQNYAYTATPDYRCGGYFRNVIQTNSKLYTANGASYPYFSTSEKTYCSLRYNSDCCTVTGGTSRDVIDIFYDREHRS